MRLSVLFSFAIVALFSPLAFGGVNEDWNQLLILDKGPATKPSTREEAISLARAHMVKHRKAIESFLAKYPNDPRAFDARLRLAGIMAATGMMDNQLKPVDDAIRQLAILEKSVDASEEKRADAGFQRVSLYMQSLRGSEDRMQDSIVSAARNFCAAYPNDRRGPRLLVEASTVCDDNPELKRKLLEQAKEQKTDEALQRRITDDLSRLDRLDKPLELDIPTTQGNTFRVSGQKGHVTAIIFWSAESPHSLIWFRDFRRSIESLPKDSVSVVTISLGTNRKAFDDRIVEMHLEYWPSYFDTKGWEGTLVRSLGINAVPTVWLVDKKGVLRSINARDNYQTWIRKLSQEQ